MDYCLKTDTLAHVGKPLYFISFKTEDNIHLPEAAREGISEGRKEVELTCTLEELEDLVGKLKDAAKQMERARVELSS